MEGYTNGYRFRSAAHPSLWWNTVKSDWYKYLMDEKSTPGDIFTFETKGSSYYVKDATVGKYAKNDHEEIKFDYKRTKTKFYF